MNEMKMSEAIKVLKEEIKFLQNTYDFNIKEGDIETAELCKKEIQALTLAITALKEKESQREATGEEIEKVVNAVIEKWSKDGQVALKNQEARIKWALIPMDRTNLWIELIYLKLSRRNLGW